MQSVKESNAIEEILSTDERINAIVRENSAPLNRDRQEIVGYENVLNLIHYLHDNLSFDEKTVLSLHNNLLELAKPNVAGKYISYEQQINNMKEMYYKSLRLSFINWHDDDNDYFYFVENFLIILYRCYKELDKQFLTVDSKKMSKFSRIEATVLNSIIPISKKDISLIF